MKKFILYIVFVLLVFGKLSAQNTDSASINQVFYKYMELAEKKDGKALSNLVSKSTIDFYSDILGHVRFSKKKKVQKLEFLEKMTVLISRHLIAREKASEPLEGGKQFFEFIVDNGTIEPKQSLALGTISFEENIAKVQVLYNGSPVPENLMVFVFVKEEEQWKIDITSIINNPFIQMTLQQTIKEAEMTELEFIQFAMKLAYGNDIDEKKIWKPIKRQKK
jgi:hypothetical protein